jgi:hypothetical protein
MVTDGRWPGQACSLDRATVSTVRHADKERVDHYIAAQE